MKLNKIIVTSDLHFTEIINFFPDPCFAIDLQGKVIAWNQAMVELTGIASSDMLGKGEYEYAISLYGSRRPLLIDLAINWNEDIAKTYKYIKKMMILWFQKLKTCLSSKSFSLYGILLENFIILMVIALVLLK
jgi:PAS domain-containing protein